MSVRLQAHMPVDIAQRVQDRAQENRRSISQEIEWLVVQSLKAEGEDVK